MKPITLLFWLLFGWFAPFYAFMVLYLKAMSMVLVLLVQVFVWICQGVLKLAGIAIKKVGLYWKNRHPKQEVIYGQIELLEEARL
jgi:hypothetical protein